MSRQDRVEKAEKHLRALEEAFTGDLRDALRLAAQGHWGMFGAYLNLPNAEDLNETYHELHSAGKEIHSLRMKLGLLDFALYTRYAAYCRRHGPNDPGEPRLAQEFLKELDSHADY